jgi:Flp pilus assembly secretin CpaC
MIGGLVQSDDLGTDQRLPILGDLPFLGPLFGSKSRRQNDSELVIIITPHLLQEGETYTPPPAFSGMTGGSQP